MVYHILKRPTFYIELSYKEIKVATKKCVSVYPVWLGKNRAVIKHAVKRFLSEDPQTLFDAMDILSNLGLDGVGVPEIPNKSYFVEVKKIPKKDKTSIFY